MAESKKSVQNGYDQIHPPHDRKIVTSKYRLGIHISTQTYTS